MNLEWVGIAVGTTSMTIAAIAVVGHYVRERHRASVLHNLDRLV